MKKNAILEVYLALVAAASLVVFAISFSVVLSKTMDYFLISWDEYKLSNRWYIEQPCNKDVVYVQGITGKTYAPPVVDEKCKKQNEEELRLKRQMEFKQTLINYLPVSIIFLVIFLIHYKTLKVYMKNHKDIEVEK